LDACVTRIVLLVYMYVLEFIRRGSPQPPSTLKYATTVGGPVPSSGSAIS